MRIFIVFDDEAFGNTQAAVITEKILSLSSFVVNEFSRDNNEFTDLHRCLQRSNSFLSDSLVLVLLVFEDNDALEDIRYHEKETLKMKKAFC
jgi:hypothetical protein